eukprot:12164002-Karenia_brevis.AAC.1
MLDVPPPTLPARHLILSIEPRSNTKEHLESFVKAGFKLASVQRDDGAYQQYFRVKENVEISDEKVA